MGAVFDVEAMKLGIICAFLAFYWVFNPQIVYLYVQHIGCPTKQTFLNGLDFLADTNNFFYDLAVLLLACYYERLVFAYLSYFKN